VNDVLINLEYKNGFGFLVFGNETKTNLNTLWRFKMTLFELIEVYIDSGSNNQFAVKKDSEDKYTALFDIYDGVEFSQSGKDLIDVVTNAAKKTRTRDDIKVTEHERAVLNGVAELIDNYSPFLRFSIFNPECPECKHFIKENDEGSILFHFIADGGDDYGHILKPIISPMDFEETIRKSTYQAALELAILDEQTCSAVIANYISYENDKNHNYAEVIIKRENTKYSALIRVNSISADRTDTNITPPVEAQAKRLEDAVKAAIKKNKTLTEYIGEHYLNRANELYSYDLIKADMLLNKLKDENIILSIHQNFDPNNKDAWLNGFYKVEFKNISNDKVLAESCNDNLKKAVFDASKKLINLGLIIFFV